MTRRPSVARGVRALLLTLVTALVVTALTTTAHVPSAQAAARVTVSGIGGAAQANPDGPTTVGLTGSGFQAVPGGFGGIYVFFGWVSDPSGGSWRPSQGGVTGTSFRYVPDAEQADNAGYQRFVAFEGSSTEAEANGGAVSADGSWSTNLVIPSARFTATDGSAVDCTQVQCGIITIGAHGVRNANNESFTPVSFGGSPPADDGQGADTRDGGDGERGGATGSDASTDPGTTPSTEPTTRRAAKASLGVDQATAVAGRVLSFGAQGLEPGEQVTVSLDDGLVAVGPLTAGGAGEVAGLLELPTELRPGTHVLRLVAPSSDTEIETEVTITLDPEQVAAREAAEADAAAQEAARSWTAAEIAVGVAALLLLIVIVSAGATSLARWTSRRAWTSATWS